MRNPIHWNDYPVCILVGRDDIGDPTVLKHVLNNNYIKAFPEARWYLHFYVVSFLRQWWVTCRTMGISADRLGKSCRSPRSKGGVSHPPWRMRVNITARKQTVLARVREPLGFLFLNGTTLRFFVKMLYR